MLNIKNIRECGMKIFICSMCEKRSGRFWDEKLMLRLLSEEGWFYNEGINEVCYSACRKTKIVYKKACPPNR